MIDYKQLLIRYIEHIKCIEGIDFIDKYTPCQYDIQLTDEEFQELRSLSNQYVEPDYSETYKSIEEDIDKKLDQITEGVKWQNATKYRFDE